MTGHTVTATRDVDAPVAAVWDVLTDLDRAEQTLTGVRRVDRVNGGPYDVGTRWRETRALGGREETQELRVSAVDPMRSTTVEASDRGVDYTTTFTLTPLAADRARLDVAFDAVQGTASSSQRILWTVLGRVGLAFTRRMLERDLADIARAAEARPRS